MHSAKGCINRNTQRIPTSHSNADVKGLDLQRGPEQPLALPQRSSSMVLDGIAPQPKIFPGVFHERNRRGSMRQGSASEKDVETSPSTVVASGFARPGPADQEGNAVYQTVTEEQSVEE